MYSLEIFIIIFSPLDCVAYVARRSSAVSFLFHVYLSFLITRLPLGHHILQYDQLQYTKSTHILKMLAKTAIHYVDIMLDIIHACHVTYLLYSYTIYPYSRVVPLKYKSDEVLMAESGSNPGLLYTKSLS
jgi:uncharacterized protein (UPF0248 family)